VRDVVAETISTGSLMDLRLTCLLAEAVYTTWLRAYVHEVDVADVLRERHVKLMAVAPWPVAGWEGLCSHSCMDDAVKVIERKEDKAAKLEMARQKEAEKAERAKRVAEARERKDAEQAARKQAKKEEKMALTAPIVLDEDTAGALVVPPTTLANEEKAKEETEKAAKDAAKEDEKARKAEEKRKKAEEKEEERKRPVVIVIDDDTDDEDRHVGKRERLVQGRKAPVYEDDQGSEYLADDERYKPTLCIAKSLHKNLPALRNLVVCMKNFGNESDCLTTDDVIDVEFNMSCSDCGERHRRLIRFVKVLCIVQQVNTIKEIVNELNTRSQRSTASHLCGVSTCLNPHHILSESHRLNCSRKKCHQRIRGGLEVRCTHTPKCIVGGNAQTFMYRRGGKPKKRRRPGGGRRRRRRRGARGGSRRSGRGWECRR
jgi:hypothetical protein